jgi:hypothetical protein
VATTCPVCGQTWPVAQPAACLCGHDFTTGDPSIAIAKLGLEKRAGNRWWLRGLGAMFFLPVTFVVLSGSPLAWILGSVHAAFVGIAIIGGLARADRAEKKLKAAKALKQLPAARVIK